MSAFLDLKLSLSTYDKWITAASELTGGQLLLNGELLLLKGGQQLVNEKHILWFGGQLLLNQRTIAAK